MTVQASAPGKLALLGEYAVLEGAPALVAAIDRRARVRIEAVSGDVCHVDAPDVDAQGAAFTVSPRGRVVWRNREKYRHLALFTAVVERLTWNSRRFGAFRANLCTRGFFAAGSKLGLGSSAALVVALAAALMRHAGVSGHFDPPADQLALLLDMHADFQRGGSGLDVAASFSGGLIAFERCSPQPRLQRIPWPAGLEMLCLWSGRSASTPRFLQAVDRSRARDPRAHATHIERMAEVACQGRDAALAGESARLLAALDAYADALDAFGKACGVPVMNGGHTRLRQLAGEAGAVYKPSGSGGGDVGVAFARDPDCLATLRATASRAGFTPVDLQIDHCGLVVD